MMGLVNCIRWRVSYSCRDGISKTRSSASKHNAGVACTARCEYQAKLTNRRYDLTILVGAGC
jgi:hypothetical protein